MLGPNDHREDSAGRRCSEKDRDEQGICAVWIALSGAYPGQTGESDCTCAQQECAKPSAVAGRSAQEGGSVGPSFPRAPQVVRCPDR